MPAAGQRHFARMARHSRNFPATRSKRESKMRTHRSSLGALVASTGLLGLLAGLSTCAEDPPKSKTQSLPAPPGAPDDTAARALLAAHVPRCRRERRAAPGEIVSSISEGPLRRSKGPQASQASQWTQRAHQVKSDEFSFWILSLIVLRESCVSDAPFERNVVDPPPALPRAEGTPALPVAFMPYRQSANRDLLVPRICRDDVKQ